MVGIGIVKVGEGEVVVKLEQGPELELWVSVRSVLVVVALCWDEVVVQLEPKLELSVILTMVIVVVERGSGFDKDTALEVTEEMRSVGMTVTFSVMIRLDNAVSIRSWATTFRELKLMMRKQSWRNSGRCMMKVYRGRLYAARTEKSIMSDLSKCRYVEGWYE